MLIKSRESRKLSSLIKFSSTNDCVRIYSREKRESGMEETEEVFTTFEMVYHNEAEAIA